MDGFVRLFLEWGHDLCWDGVQVIFLLCKHEMNATFGACTGWVSLDLIFQYNIFRTLTIDLAGSCNTSDISEGEVIYRVSCNSCPNRLCQLDDHTLTNIFYIAVYCWIIFGHVFHLLQLIPCPYLPLMWPAYCVSSPWYNWSIPTWSHHWFLHINGISIIAFYAPY